MPSGSRAQSISNSVRVHPSALEPLFARLVQEWKQGTRLSSSLTEIATHPAYQRIIGLGWDALPFIFRELNQSPDHWFWALKAITGEDPVPASARGNLQEMTKAWLEWAATHQLVAAS